MYENLVSRFLEYVKINTRSNSDSITVPSTRSQMEFGKKLVEDMEEIGLEDCKYDEKSGFVTGTLPGNMDREVDTIGFIAHMDTADFNAEGVDPQTIEDYDGESDIELDQEGKYKLTVEEFPNLKNYKGHTLITTDGRTLLGADDKAGIVEILGAMEYLIDNPDIKRGKVRIAFGPDEEIGTGAQKFDVDGFGADFAFTVDGGPLGELQYETFNAASAIVKFKGVNVHPGTAKGVMVNSMKLAMDFHSSLPEQDVPEKTEGHEGFYMLHSFEGGIEDTELIYIIRDHDRKKFEARKKAMEYIVNRMNKELGEERVSIELEDSYYNMREVIEKDMSIVDLAERAMLRLDIDPVIEPVRGGTDGSTLSFMGLPTPNLFAGGENMHGRYEFISIETMEKARDTIVEIIKLNANPL